MEKFLEITYLFDFYQNLLTPKQRDLIIGYYFDDLSLGELAAMHEISRQSVFDTIKKAQNKLIDYEKKLGVWERHQLQQAQLETMEKLTLDAMQTLEGDARQYAKSMLQILDQLTTKDMEEE